MLSGMKDNLEPDDCAKKLGALASPERLRIIQSLRAGPKNVGQVTDELGMKLVNASHHLNVLLNAGLVRNERQGRHILYSLLPGALQEGESGDTEHLDLGCCRLEIPKPGERGQE
jgi:DNA-binding transcriptional ArsR family regulator